MKKSEYIFKVLCICATFLFILNSCGLEKRLVVTTRGHEATYPNEYHVPNYELLQNFDNSPRDTILNYRIR